MATEQKRKSEWTIVVIMGEDTDATKVYRVPNSEISDGTIRLLKNPEEQTEADIAAYNKDWEQWTKKKYEIKHMTGERGGIIVGADWC